jgi:hypothetical protein
MKRGILFAGALIVGLSSVSAVIAQSDPIAERQQIMKKNNQELRPLTNVLRGSAPFELDKVQAALKGTVSDYKRVAVLWSTESQTGQETRALPKVWTDKAGFDAAMSRFIAMAEAAQGTIKDEVSFKAEFPKIMTACDSCHETYRAARR